MALLSIFIQFYGLVCGHLIEILICLQRSLFIIHISWCGQTSTAQVFDETYEYVRRIGNPRPLGGGKLNQVAGVLWVLCCA